MNFGQKMNGAKFFYTSVQTLRRIVQPQIPPRCKRKEKILHMEAEELSVPEWNCQGAIF
jgi:hypothetical protein